MNTEYTLDLELVSRVTPALDAALSAPPSAAAVAAINAAAHTRARAIRFRRRARFTLSLALPLAACFAIMLSVFQFPHNSAPPRNLYESYMTFVELSPADFNEYFEVDGEYYDDDDDDDGFVYEEIQYAAPAHPRSPFAIFSARLVAMQDYPSYCYVGM